MDLPSLIGDTKIVTETDVNNVIANVLDNFIFGVSLPKVAKEVDKFIMIKPSLALEKTWNESAYGKDGQRMESLSFESTNDENLYRVEVKYSNMIGNVKLGFVNKKQYDKFVSESSPKIEEPKQVSCKKASARIKRP
jgi:hypothetical protein